MDLTCIIIPLICVIIHTCVMISSMISSLYIAMGELYCLVAILGLPTVVKPLAF
jgi:hypothetical protein